MQKLFIATGNAHKVAEFKEMFARRKLDFEILGANELGGMPHCVEDGKSFEENAIIKANCLKSIAPKNSYILADDSGIVVDALSGAPGIYSARYAGVEGKDADFANNEKLLKALENVPDEKRTAHFACALALICPNGKVKTFYAQFHGVINHGAKGIRGFGYDPLFFLPEKNMTSAEISEIEKNTISHRAKALSSCMDFLETL